MLRVSTSYAAGKSVGFLARPWPGPTPAVAPNPKAIVPMTESAKPFTGYFQGEVAGLPDGVHEVCLVEMPNGPVFDRFLVRIKSGQDADAPAGAGPVPPPPPPPPPKAPPVANASFEVPHLPERTDGRPGNAGWTFAVPPATSTSKDNAGVASNGSPYTSGGSDAPDGMQVALIQGKGSASQLISGWAAGSYVVRFKAAGRANWGGFNDFQVQIDGKAVGTFKPATTAYAELATPAFPVSAGDHTLAFVGLNTAGGDNTSFIDDVRIETAPAPTAKS